MNPKFNITVFEIGPGYCDVYRKEDIKTGDIIWLDYDVGKYHIVEEPRKSNYELMYKQLLRETKLNLLIND